MDVSIVGKRVKEVRERKGMTQEALAAKVDISTTHVSVIERGLKVPKLDTFVALANALGVSSDELLIDFIEHSDNSIPEDLSYLIKKLPPKERKKLIQIVKAFVEE